MANPALGRSDSSGHELNLGTVDRMRVRVGYGRMLEGPPHDVFLLDVPLARADETFDEMPYLEALEPILYAGAETSRLYSVHVNRHHTNWGPGAAEAEIRMNLTTGSSSAALADAALDAIAIAFRSVFEQVGSPERLGLRHDEAKALARVLVEEAFPEVHSDVLSVSDEEHRAAQDSWSIGLRTRDLDRYVVIIGFLDGYAGSAHVRHQPRSEVLDSVGSEIP